MRCTGLAVLLSQLVFVLQATAQSTKPAPMTVDPAWLQARRLVAATDFSAEGVRAVFFDSVPLNGKPTRAFAWIGLPTADSGAKPQKFPAMVLVHGGGGTAFEKWVRLWNSRGYAAIAMDTCGQVPRGKYGHWDRDPQGGPPGWGGFDQVDQPPQDQWTYHAVADVILAHSLIRSLPEVDRDRTGLTGISWGGYLTCIVAGLDNRFKLAVPVYGCGFLGDDSAWREKILKMGPAGADWLTRWDPLQYLPNAKMPMLWVTGTNDFAYPMDSLQRSYRLPSGPHTVCLRIRMPHGHNGPGENPEEIHALADSVLKGGAPLDNLGEPKLVGDELQVQYHGPSAIAKAELCYTSDVGAWQKREWKTIAARIEAESKRVRADVPSNARVFYLNLTDSRGLIISSEHIERN